MKKTAKRRAYKCAKLRAVKFNALLAADPAAAQEFLGQYVNDFACTAKKRANRLSSHRASSDLVWDLFGVQMHFIRELNICSADKDNLINELSEICRRVIDAVRLGSAGRLGCSRHIALRYLKLAVACWLLQFDSLLSIAAQVGIDQLL